MPKIEDEIKKLMLFDENNKKEWVELNDVCSFLKEMDSDEEIVLFFSRFFSQSRIMESLLVTAVAVKNESIAAFKEINPIIEEKGWTCGFKEGFEPPREDVEFLYFRRDFEERIGEENKTYIEIYQKLIHLLDLHYVQHKKSYCTYASSGDLIEVIKIVENEEYQYVTIKKKYLKIYLGMNDSTLVRCADCIRFYNFGGWDEIKEIKSEEMTGTYSKQENASFVRAFIPILKKIKTKKLKKYMKTGSIDKEKFESFAAYDPLREKITKASCDPNLLSTFYNMKDNSNPHELSQIFFKHEVLGKYYSNPDKYEIKGRYISCKTGGWDLKIDINENDIVHSTLIDMSMIPYKEQLHWKQYNIKPPREGIMGGISERSFMTDFMGEWYESDDLTARYRDIIKTLNDAGLWNISGTMKVKTIIDENSKDWADSIGNLHNMFINSIIENKLKEILKQNNPNNVEINGMRSLKLIEEILKTDSFDVSRTAILWEIKNIRDDCYGHPHSVKMKYVEKAKAKDGSLKNNYTRILNELLDCLMFLESYLKKK